MEIFYGKAIFRGIAIGKILFNSKTNKQVEELKLNDAEAEISRFEKLKKKLRRNLKYFTIKL